ncbi:MAG: hypothetical protein ABSB69_04710 [Solirubrobacteraceae bacterium]
MTRPRIRPALLALVAFTLAAGLLAPRAGAEGLVDDGGAEWRVEPIYPPAPSVGVEVQKQQVPIGLGRIGDIEFWAPNRGALITAGNGTIKAGVWLYDGESWRELSTVCGASEGRIAWAGPDEFWTISDGRPGQADSGGVPPPLEDDTLCHFAPPPGDPTGALEVVASYAQPAFLSTSYEAMHGAACITPSDCWFGGDPLQPPEVGAFQLHWNGHTVEPEPYLPEGHAVRDMREFEGRLYESVQLLRPCENGISGECDRVRKVLRHPPAMRIINGEGAPEAVELVEELPLLGKEEFFYALNFLHLSADENSLWGAAGPELKRPEGSQPAGVTVIRKEDGASSWSQVLGPESVPTGLERFPEDVADSIAAEPASASAWIALDSKADATKVEPNPDESALVARIASNGAVTDELKLPSSSEPYGYKGAADKLACPAAHDCWLATTTGWLLHLSTASERKIALDTDPVFSSEEPIEVRPHDEGLPQEPSDALPAEEAPLEESVVRQGALKPVLANPFATVTLPLLSHVRSRLVHGTTLELKFNLSVKARVRLVAERHRSVVASTAAHVFQAGNRSLLLRLNVHRWPTKLNLQTHALAPLKTASTREAGSSTDSVSTSLAFPNRLRLPGSGLLP